MSRWSSPIPLEDGLARLLVGRDAEGRIFGSKLRQREAELLLVRLGLRLDRDLDDRPREIPSAPG